MKQSSISKHSESDLHFLHHASDEEIDFSDIPEISEEQMSNAVVRIGGQPAPSGKVRINIHLDADIVAYFKVKAGGRGYQTLINDTLRGSIDRENMETTLRQIIREELAAASP